MIISHPEMCSMDVEKILERKTSVFFFFPVILVRVMPGYEPFSIKTKNNCSMYCMEILFSNRAE